MNLNVDNLTELIAASVREILNKSCIIPVSELKKTAAASSSSKNTPVNSQSAQSVKTIQLLNKKVIVEEDIKVAFKQNAAAVEIMKSALITPSARDMANSKKIKLIKK